MAADKVGVVAGARLHLGFLDPGGEAGRRFGGIGLALAAPATRIAMEPARGETLVEGPDRTRARWHLEALRSRLGYDYQHQHMRIESLIPARAGLGSGTQLALAVAAALRRLNGVALDPAGDLAFLGRGKTSALGPALFAAGGLVVDGGKGAGEAPPPVVARVELPAAWRVVLLIDPAEAGPPEGEPMPAPGNTSDAVCRHVLMEALPAAVEGDLPAFGRAIEAVQASNAMSPGGFLSPRVAALATALRSAGASGIGQSYRGPTGFGFVASEGEGAEIVRRLRTHPEAGGLDIRLAAPRNEGALIGAAPAPAAA